MRDDLSRLPQIERREATLVRTNAQIVIRKHAVGLKDKVVEVERRADGYLEHGELWYEVCVAGGVPEAWREADRHLSLSRERVAHDDARARLQRTVVGHGDASLVLDGQRRDRNDIRRRFALDVAVGIQRHARGRLHRPGGERGVERIVRPMVEVRELAAEYLARIVLQRIADEMACRVRGRPDVVLVDGIPCGDRQTGIRVADEVYILEPERRRPGVVVEPKGSGRGSGYRDVSRNARIVSAEVLKAPAD